MTSSSNGKAERREDSQSAGAEAAAPISRMHLSDSQRQFLSCEHGSRDYGSSVQALRPPLPDKPKKPKRSIAKRVSDKSKSEKSLSEKSMSKADGATVPGMRADVSLADTIEAEIIPRLWLAHRGGDAPRTDDAAINKDGAAPPRTAKRSAKSAVSGQIDVDALALCAVREPPGVLLARIDALLQQGVGLETVLLEALAPTARRLGQLWNEDVYSFTDVTIGLCRVRQVFEELKVRLPEAASAPERFSAVVMAAPGDDHSFGAAVIGHLFEQAGWALLAPSTCTSREALALLRLNSVDMLGISLNTDQGLDALPSFVLKVRKESKNRDLTIFLGGGLIAARPDIAREVGAIAAVGDPKRAIEQAEDIVRRVARRI